MLTFLKRLWTRHKTKRSGSRESDSLSDARASIHAADVDPRNSEMLSRYDSAMQDKKNGNLELAATKLEASCVPASIYKGHYRELFKIWRSQNRNDLKQAQYRQVIDRVEKMIRYDDEMIQEMLSYLGEADASCASA